ncbi:adenosylcobinamide-GDP ribazoletransferase [Algiphilus sp. NNCM1]|uniref:adenosylcobinamide-GDP ribazoletransferase n=1 Tax=Algiphilus sp. TaxID=1872431 RepID=UPI001CA6B75A|nr:adenosylcobinamide-GDP ribazoletransferase [Algiphilus sp.]MBY8966438.1 adenosylcobinamide-GDP ribazoletransferase [Algiphilus acroporae]MCI5103193.1 adenosylcobinamide-GDP ribazoletransferase [Algiphilus sp.]
MGNEPALRRHWRAFLIALQFLSIVPVRLQPAPEARENGLSLLYYPLVGLLLGLLLAAVAGTIQGFFPAPVVAALLIALWALLTGALHLDGVADSADGWLGGGGDRARTLRIMQDPHSGAAGVVALIVALLLKWSALSALLLTAWWWLLVLVPMLGRAAAVLLLAHTPYARRGGIASAMLPQMSRTAVDGVALAAVAAALLLTVWAAGLAQALWLLLLPAAAVWGWRRWVQKRLGGTTGDTAGAAIEGCEAVALMALSATL